MYIYTCIHVYMHTYEYILVHMYMYGYIHMYMYMLTAPTLPFVISSSCCPSCYCPPKQLPGCGVSTSHYHFCYHNCLICTISSEPKYFLIVTHLNEPGLNPLVVTHLNEPGLNPP